MTFADAIRSITEFSQGTAVKRPSMRGYVKIKDRNDETGAYKLQFITAEASAGDISGGTDSGGGTADPTDDTGSYVFSWSGAAWTAPTGDSALAVDAQLFAALIADDWAVGDAADYEAARSGGGGRW